MIANGKKCANTFPNNPIQDKKIKVDKTAPVPNKYSSFCLIFSWAILDEKTPAQNKIVNGFETVSNNPPIKEFSNAKLSIPVSDDINPKLLKIVLTPK
jgi:hypothetical protein